MQWIENIINQLANNDKEHEILVSSGASPSGVYHFGHLREIVIADAIVRALKKNGYNCRHVHVSDNLDAFRKVPVNLPAEYEQYLGYPLCEVPAPDGSGRSWGDFCLDPFLASAKTLGVSLDVFYANKGYRDGFFVPAIERSLANAEAAKLAIETVSGRKLDEHWTPIQILENGRLKNRQFVSIDKDNKTITYLQADGDEATARYDRGEVKLDWRLDWPGRWWLLGVTIEPFGRDHATKGGSYDTGVEIARNVYEITPPIPVPYEFVNRSGDTKKMSASKGTGIGAHEVVAMLPPEVVRYFMLRYSPSKRLYFDETESLVRLIDDFSVLVYKDNKTPLDEEILFYCMDGVPKPAVSSIPFSHLVVTYQASLNDVEKTLSALRRSEHAKAVTTQESVIRSELSYVATWIANWAPDALKFELRDSIDANEFTEPEKQYLLALAADISDAPSDADGMWFHKTIYGYKENAVIDPKDLFAVLYRALIGKTAGPRAGWFLSILPRDWLISRLELKK